jgi:murein DD-endopeptidase MepM/ murein hydrolase activator NlpD
MKNKFYASLFIWISLIVVATPGLAKSSPPPAKKPAAGAAKADKSNTHAATSSKKPEKAAPVKQQAGGKNHAPEKHDTKVADSKGKHDKSDKRDKKTQQVADSKDSKNKHDKKSHPVADADDDKRGKSKNHVAEAKEDKHGKYKKAKEQQLAESSEKKYRRKKSHHTDEVTPDEENSEDASTAVYEDENTPVEKAEQDSSLLPSAPKSTPLFFQPLDKQVATEQRHEAESSGAFISAPSKENPALASRNRVHTQLDNGTRSTVIADDEPESDDVFAANTQPSYANKRIHSSLSRGRSNDLINNAVNSESPARVIGTHAVIDGSLDEAGAKAGLSNDMINELADVFAWDIDFANNIQTGDQFTLIYEEGSGNAGNRIVAAQFVNRGKVHTAIRYKDKEGIVSYYTPDGRSLRKAFLSTPIDYARVSSHFDPHRMHPVLNRIRAHKGVDYAARTGTPVKAAGDGVVTFHGNKGGYGRMIVLAHGEHYETAYAHLSNFRENLQDGEPVKQGDVIGYVGQSGLATGPHLHYEFRVDGEHRDPEKLDSKQAMRLPNGIWEDFHSQTVPILTQLNQAKNGAVVAKNL